MWAQATTTSPAGGGGDDSDDGCVSIDFSAYCFGKVVDHLRLLAIAREGDRSALAPPQVRADQRDNFARLVRYYFPGQEDTFIGAVPSHFALSGFNVKIDTSKAEVAVCSAATAHCCAVGAVVLPHKAVWKVKVKSDSGWGLVGVIGNANPDTHWSYKDSTSYGWAGSNQVWLAGTNIKNRGGWGTWEANDEAILRLDLGGTKPRLIMWHKRISRIFTIGLPERQDGWRLHIGLHHDNINHMHLMLPSADETALVQ